MASRVRIMKANGQWQIHHDGTVTAFDTHEQAVKHLVAQQKMRAAVRTAGQALIRAITARGSR